jgi:hypothetical protein
MWSITYMSTEVAPFTRSQLYDLLTASRKKSARLGVTGLLLYKGGIFIQTIEGDDDAVTDLYESIRSDARHRDVTTVFSGRVPAAKFPNWTMGFRDLNLHAPELPSGYSSLLNEPWSKATLNRSAADLRAFIGAFTK